jgi:lysozyme
MKELDALEKQLIRHEGVRAKPYRCTAGCLTIGAGRNLDANGLREDEILLMLRNDIKAVEDALFEKLPWFQDLDQVRQEVLINMGFNLGIAGLLAFKQTLGHIERGEYAAAANRMMASKWAGQVGKRAKELANQMQTGRYAVDDR